MQILKQNIFFLLLITLLIAGSLVNINVFGPPTLAAYFSYTIIGTLIALLTGIIYFTNKQLIVIANKTPIVILGFISVYYFFNGLINKQGGINLRHYIILADALLLFSYCILHGKGKITLISISRIITSIAAIESIICILQQFSIIPSMDGLFLVTGSNVNPNVTAMFLAMSIPAILFVLFQPSTNPIRVLNSYRIISITSLILCLCALAFLQCRTAIIGAAVGITLILNHHFQLINKLRNKFSKAVLSIIGIISITLIIVTLLFLYHSKQASSDGRMFIWKISLQAIAEKPLLGSGYGQFEHDYNLAQARYFAKNTASQQEIYNASYVHMSYNEFLENLFEGGIIGLVLFVVLLASLLLSYASDSCSFYAITGIAIFTIMCFFNFTVQALPVRALFIIYAGVCCVECKGNPHLDLTTYQKLSNLANSNIFYRTSFRVVATFLSLFLFLKLLTLSKAYNKCSNLIETQNELSSNEALHQMAILKGDLSQSTYYFNGYANLLFRTKHYDAAIEKYKMALNYTSKPDLLMELGNCLTVRGRFSDAEQAFTLAENIEPHRFIPKYWLMKIYGFAKDTVNAKVKAQQIIAMKPKVESEKVAFYKRVAKKLIDN